MSAGSTGFTQTASVLVQSVKYRKDVLLAFDFLWGM